MWSDKDPKVVFGRAVEAIVRRWLYERGFFVVKTSDISGGAPMLEAAVRKGCAVLPDNLASKDGRSRWVEVKGKRKAKKFQKHNEFRTGCDLKNFDDYVRVQNITGIPGYICFVHTEEQRILLSPLDRINPVGQRLTDPASYRVFGKPMVFFNVDLFDQYRLSGRDICVLRELSQEPGVNHPWDSGNKRLPPRQFGLFNGEAV